MVLIVEEKPNFVFINVDAEVFWTIHMVSKKYFDCSEDCKYTFNTAYSLHKAIAFGEHILENFAFGHLLTKMVYFTFRSHNTVSGYKKGLK